MNQLRERAEEEAIRVFAAQPEGPAARRPGRPKAVIGLDPGIRTGVKVAVVDRTGKVLDTATVYPHEPRNDWEGSLHVLAPLARKHGAELISIGNGTASRETDKLAADLMKRHPGIQAGQGRRQRGRRLGVFGLGARRARVPRNSTSACAAPSPSPAACRTRWPNW
jgi:uncharacterized protein